MSAIPNSALPLATANFETREIDQIDELTMRIKPSIGSLAFGLLLFILGIGLTVFWGAKYITPSVSHPMYLLAMGILFTVLGIILYRRSNEQVIINSEIGTAFIQNWLPSVPKNTESMSQHYLPKDTKAIQMVSKVVKYHSGGKTTPIKQKKYTEYQVNICTIEDERVNLFVTLNSAKAIRAGTSIAQILKVELVNHIDIDRVLDFQ